MPEIVEQQIRTIDPNAHPHVLLHCLGKPADELSAADATIKLQQVIAGISDDSIFADAADKLTNYCVPLDISPTDRFEISQELLSSMKLIRDRELHPPARER
jgi:hypothetical protein